MGEGYCACAAAAERPRMKEDDDLLQWLSFRQSGSRKDLPEAQLAGRQPALVLWRMAVLAHIEIQPPGRWSVVPPTLAGLGDDGHEYAAILCGARTRGVVAKLRRACDALAAGVDELEIDSQPSRIRVRAYRPGALERIADQADLAYQPDAGFALLAALPAIGNWPRERIPAIAGRAARVTRFSRKQLRWIDASLDEAAISAKGLFHIRRDWDAVTVLKRGADCHCSIDTAAGRLAIARGLKLARFDAASGRFEIPAALTPPAIMARALTLASGIVPVRDRTSGLSRFADVPQRTAMLALGLMELRLQ